MKSFQTLSSTLLSKNSFWLFSYCEGFLKFLAEQDYAKRTLQVLMPISALKLQAHAQHRWRQGIDFTLRLEFENGLKSNKKTEFTSVLAGYWTETTQFRSIFQKFSDRLAKVGSPAVSNSPSLFN